METVICGHEVFRDVSQARVRSLARPLARSRVQTCLEPGPHTYVALVRAFICAQTHVHAHIEAYPGTA